MTPRSITGPALLLALTSWMQPSPAASFFQALELRPEQVANAQWMPPATVLASLPASREERHRLVRTLLTEEPTPDRAQQAALLLELWGEQQRALEILRGLQPEAFDPLHLVRIEFRHGSLHAAKELFGPTQCFNPSISPAPEAARHRLRRAIEPFIAHESLGELDRFLAWLQPQCRIGEWRSAVLAQRLELALHRGTLPCLLGKLSKESPLSRLIAGKMLNPQAPAIKPAGAKVIDLAWLVCFDGLNWECESILEQAIREGGGSPDERIELLRQMIRSYRYAEPRGRLLRIWMERESEFSQLLTKLGPVFHYSTGLPFEPLCSLAERQPDNAYLNFLAGFNQTTHRTSGQKSVVTRSALESLERAFEASPLLRLEPPATNANGAGTPCRRPLMADDVARHALTQLAARLTSTQLYEMIRSRDDWDELPLPDKLRYLNAADLPLPYLDLVFETDWHDPRNDPYGGSVSFPMSPYGTGPPEDLVPRFNTLLPDIILGSSEKSARQVAEHSALPLERLFGSHAFLDAASKAMLRAWHRGLEARGPEFAEQVLAWRADDHGEARNLELIRTILGPGEARRQEDHAQVRRSRRDKLLTCLWFAPPQPSGFPFGHEPRALGRDVSFAGEDWIEEASSRHPWLIPRYPSLAAMHPDGPVVIGGSQTPATRSWAARLRAALPAKSPLCEAYDIAVASDILVPLDHKTTTLAEHHVGTMLATRKDFDFVLFRASAGISLGHGQRPTDPRAIAELATLSGSAVPVRRAAAGIASRAPAAEDRKALLASLGHPRPHRPSHGGFRGGPAPPPSPTTRHVIEALEATPDLDEVVRTLEELPYRWEVSPYPALSSPEVLARFEAPHHLRLLDLLRLEFEPRLGLSGSDEAMRPPGYGEIMTFHQFLASQDPEAAATLREILIERDLVYPGEIGEQLFQQGQAEEAIDWLARSLVRQHIPPMISRGVHRFPKKLPHADPYLLDKQLSISVLRFIEKEKLALPVATRIEELPGVKAPVLCAFLRFYDTPSLRAFDRHLGTLSDPRNPHLASTLRQRLPNLLRRLAHTKDLAEELKASASQDE